ncbi:hypothetical protein BABINDRAFT_169147 [Babjeviella inositovora NRRL Y-12698]|uniref:Palmitoyl-protein thioesterase 1 n=1 Tax=Babjeviella inositovora NRRL Y-12698 TaxID=984486 RepID=A0A1E3QKM5_9ASCO|nr:uncharacterized protein BABINDRAFT_169147 [Babjeviella inositovora NRRL Y-12698]ODQ77547.1 hypothetical protein BABINDRAFT_169147 [Babjeviella inositovora NRRL Y-12698]
MYIPDLVSSLLFTLQALFRLPTPLENAASLPDSQLPLVIWHGLGDTYNSDSMQGVIDVIHREIPNLYVHSVYVNEDGGKDEEAGFFGDASAQIELVCQQLLNDTKLSRGFNAIGFSQGGLFLRAVLEKCGPESTADGSDTISIKNLITFGSPHLGVSDLPTPACGSFDWACRQRNRLLKSQVWNSRVQHQVVPAQYFRAFNENYEKYLENSRFLVFVNNEVEHEKTDTFRANFGTLNNLVLVQFANDTVLVPKESAWFMGDRDEENQLYAFDKTPIYVDNLVGLKKLHLESRIQFHVTEGEHMRIGDDFLIEIARKYL